MHCLCKRQVKTFEKPVRPHTLRVSPPASPYSFICPLSVGNQEHRQSTSALNFLVEKPTPKQNCKARSFEENLSSRRNCASVSGIGSPGLFIAASPLFLISGTFPGWWPGPFHRFFIAAGGDFLAGIRLNHVKSS